MSGAKYTPGPWDVDDCGNICGSGAALANVFGAEDYPCLPEEDYDAVNVECAANARLMAAAPELLAALKDAEWIMRSRVLPEHLDRHAAKALEQARAALAKAGVT